MAESVENLLVEPDAVFRGIGFPFRRGSSEIPAAVTDDELLADTLAQLILTAPGTRVMRPELGSGAGTFVFETNDDVLSGLIRTSVGNVIARFEPRVVVRRIDVSRTNASLTDVINKDAVIIKVNYVVPATQEVNSVSIQVGLNEGKVG